MILLDGVDLFYSCELGATLLHKSVLRNEWAEVLNHAIHLFRSEQYKKSFIRYLEAAFLGHSNGFRNHYIKLERMLQLLPNYIMVFIYQLIYTLI